MVLQGGPCGRVGRRRTTFHCRPPDLGQGAFGVPGHPQGSRKRSSSCGRPARPLESVCLQPRRPLAKTILQPANHGWWSLATAIGRTGSGSHMRRPRPTRPSSGSERVVLRQRKVRFAVETTHCWPENFERVADLSVHCAPAHVSAMRPWVHEGTRLDRR